MKKLELKLTVTSEPTKEKVITFVAPSELLLSGFKFSYVSPEKLEDEIFAICDGDHKFSANSKNNCLEEGLLNSHQDEIIISDENCWCVST